MSEFYRMYEETYKKATPLAKALDAISAHGCRCKDSQQGTCMACLCEAGLREEWERANAAESELQKIQAALDKAQNGTQK